MANTETLQTRLDNFARLAVNAEKETQVPAALTIAQWAVESGWGKAPSGNNNYFGITFNKEIHKAFDWVPTGEVLSQIEIDRLDPDERATITAKILRSDGKFNVRLSRRFAAFDDPMEGVLEHARLITKVPIYAKAWSGYLRDRNVETLIAGVADAGYATGDDYKGLVLRIARQSNVQKAIEKARSV